MEPGRTGAEQMALDETMLRLADRPALRVYRWARAEVTFGYPQRWAEAEKFAAGRPATRRCTGGGFVEHGTDVTLALVLPAGHPLTRSGPAEIYQRIHATLAAALGLRLAGADEARTGAACFANPANGDVMDGSRKVAGGALRRTREGVLYQGSVLEEADFAAALGSRVVPWSPPDRWGEVFADLAGNRYGTAAWNRRR